MLNPAEKIDIGKLAVKAKRWISSKKGRREIREAFLKADKEARRLEDLAKVKPHEFWA